MSQVVLISRQRDDAQALCTALTQAGFTSIVWPAVHVIPHPPSSTLEVQLRSATVLALPSPNAVRSLNALLHQLGLQWRNLAADLWAQGEGTAAALPQGVSARCSPEPYAESMAQAIAAAHPGATITFLCGDQARPNFHLAAEKQGCPVDQVVIYANREPKDLAHPPQALLAAVYYSPTAVHRHLRANPWLRQVPAVAVGRTTAQALQTDDHEQVIQAASPAIASVLGALEAL